MKQNKQRNQRKNKTGKRSTRAHPGVATLATNRGLPTGFPDKILSKLRYVDLMTLTSTVGSIGKNAFRWNSTFDPDATGTGHQPLYRDTFSSVYDQYAVISATARVKFINPGTNPMRVGVLTDDDFTSSTTVDTLCEQNHGQHVLLPPMLGSLSSHTFTISWDCKQILGIDPFSSETYKTAVGSNPSEESYLHVWASDPLAGTTSVYVEVELVQIVLWTELGTPVQS